MKHLKILKLVKCKHCEERTTMTCAECGEPVCYDCARVSTNYAHFEEPVCQDCKEKEKEKGKWNDFVMACDHAEISDADGDGPCPCSLQEWPAHECNPTTCPRKED